MLKNALKYSANTFVNDGFDVMDYATWNMNPVIENRNSPTEVMQTPTAIIITIWVESRETKGKMRKRLKRGRRRN